MGERIELAAADGHRLGAYRANPIGSALGGVVVLQEIFGVNAHIRSVCDSFAAKGYSVIAPALFDRYRRDFESGYSPEEIAEARPFLAAFDWTAALLDLDAAAGALRRDVARVAAVGFCLGGSLAWLAAARRRVDVAVCYYGGQIIKMVDERPAVPTILHFGREDHTIPMSDVETIASLHPDLPIHVYSAGHGFHCDARASFDPESSALAWQRTNELLSREMEATGPA